MAKAQKESWTLVALDCVLAEERPGEEPMVRVLATLAQYDRAVIAKRTREALAARKATTCRTTH